MSAFSQFMPGRIPGAICSGKIHPIYCCTCLSPLCLRWAEVAAVDNDTDHSVCMAYFAKGDRRFTAIGDMPLCDQCRSEVTRDRVIYFAHWHGETVSDIPTAIAVLSEEPEEIRGVIARDLFRQIWEKGYNLLTGRVMAAADLIRGRQRSRGFIARRIAETAGANAPGQALYPIAEYYRGYLEMLDICMEA